MAELDITQPTEIVIQAADLPQDIINRAAEIKTEAPVQVPAEIVAPAPAADDPQSGLDALRHQLSALTAERDRLRHESAEHDRRRAEAERLASAAHTRITEQNATVAARDITLTDTQLAAQTELMSSIQTQQETALAAGDFARAAELNIKAAQVAARVENLGVQKQYLEDQVRQRAAAPPVVAAEPRQQQPSAPRVDMNSPWLTPTEIEHASRAFSAPAAAWMRQNPRFYNDLNFRQQVVAADARAKQAGYAPDSDQYFRYIESTVGVTQSAAATATPVVAAPVRSAAPPAAAPSRSVPGTTPSGAMTINLTPEERRTAHEIMTPDVIGPGKDPEVEYAKHLIRERQNGGRQWGPQQIG